ncbi:Sensor histidine kinase DesK [Actinomadura rubteroloni]|uniref:Sensor histidine kinase DesK n=1 Tax=Actinomadura rubteroloni TaxID=1926885 RepID=A0A2P4ULQ6_9ACTN|nr:sensor histidine kinase [Actinomadura rubteroloni]POM25980.1 Sensor histidine kinase DesK [Actinomadura rubteroloni]
MKTVSSAFFGDSDSPGRLRRSVWGSLGLLYLVPTGTDIAHEDGARRVLGLTALAAFVAVYVATLASRRTWLDPCPPVTWALLGALTALTAGLPFAFGSMWIGLPIYLSTVSTMTLPSPGAFFAPAGCAALLAVQGAATGVGTSETASLAITTFSVGMLLGAFRHSRTLVHQLKEARGEVARLAAADERLRIARDLHDLLGQSLSLIVLKSEIALRDTGRTVAEMDDIRSVARQALADVRGTISGYRARGLREEIASARAVLAAASVEATVDVPDGDLPAAVDALFGWAVREAATNVARHSGARHCSITVGRADGAATLEVADDGRAAAAPTPGNGLSGLAERVAAAGGTVTAGAGEGGGFRLFVTVPAVPEESRPSAVSGSP